MTSEQLFQIETEARRMRADFLRQKVRDFFRRSPRATVAGTRTA